MHRLSKGTQSKETQPKGTQPKGLPTDRLPDHVVLSTHGDGTPTVTNLSRSATRGLTLRCALLDSPHL